MIPRCALNIFQCADIFNQKQSTGKRSDHIVEITRLEPKEKTGLVVVITGYGKGKTTTALGIAVRACGHNIRTCIIQFMKGDIYAGEWDGIKKMDCPVELISTGKGFCGIQGNPYPYEEHKENAQDAVQITHQKIESGRLSWMRSTMRCI
jgi:cob(I)alamin adenosyltransferase